MAWIFTEHVRQFRADSDAAERVLPELERLLKQRMRRKNLLSAPPSYLGYSGVSSWDQAGVFEDIRSDCYLFAILLRLKGLRNQLLVRTNIEGLIVRNVDHFLLERQRKHDPIGYAVYGNVEGAVHNATEVGRLVVDGMTDGRLPSSSILRLDPLRPDAAVVDPERVREGLAQVLDWVEALPSLISVTEEGQEWVTAFLDRLKGMEISAVRCGDLVAVLAAQAREDRASRHVVPDQVATLPGGRGLRPPGPYGLADQGFEDRDRWEALKRQVADRIVGLDRQQRVLERLTAVFDVLVRPSRKAALSRPLRPS